MLTQSDTADIIELTQLGYRYAAAVDACDDAAFVSVFWPEAVLSVFAPNTEAPFSVAQGHHQLANIPQMMRTMYQGTAHQMTNHLVDLDGDHAKGNMLCTAHHLIGDADHMVVIRYIDRYERRDQHWRMLNRNIHFLWAETVPAHTGEKAISAIMGTGHSK